jgi:N-methylhydantoinase A
VDSYIIGIDVGGTFTDVVAASGRRLWRAKAPTVPEDFAAGVIDACGRIAKEIGVPLADLVQRTVRFGLGTTAVTNVLVSHVGTKSGLLTTAGFEDLMPTAKGRRIAVDGWLEPPWSPVPEELIIGIPERVAHDGRIVLPLDESAVIAAGLRLVKRDRVEAMAVSFLWSFVNDSNERRCAEILRGEFPGIPVFVGAELHPVMREYERTTVACLNAVCSGSVDGIARLETHLRELGLSAPFLVLQANGGAMTVEQARLEPMRMADSGPAAGVVAAAEVAASLGLDQAVCGDMGGTSYDVAVITAGRPVKRHRGQAGGVITARSTVDVESVGSGGGSIAWIDRRGMLRVGPRSARAKPGPACYGRGGREATVTDAMLVLGYLDGDNFLGGSMRLDIQAARDACENLGAQLRLGMEDVAWGIREIALNDMVRATRTRMANSGVDPKVSAFVTYGGSGSLFSTEIARKVGISRVLAPEMASVLSAFGAASAPLIVERTRSINRLFKALDEQSLGKEMQDLAAVVDRDLAAVGVPSSERTARFEVDVRFIKQLSELTIPLSSPSIDISSLAKDFEKRYETKYGRGAILMSIPMELVLLRAIGVGNIPSAAFAPMTRGATHMATPRPRGRSILTERSTPSQVSLFNRSGLSPGEKVAGPALVEDSDNTLWIPEGAHATMDDFRTVVVTL